MSAIFHTKRTVLEIRDTLDNIRFEYVSKETARFENLVARGGNKRISFR
jgi:hypothetical protein